MDYINELLIEVAAPFSCEFSETKGRVLRVSESFEPLANLFQGPILHKISEDKLNPIFQSLNYLFDLCTDGSLDYGAMWYWCGLNSLPFRISHYIDPIPDEKCKQLKLLYHPEVISPSRTVQRVCEAIKPYLERPLSESEMIEIDLMAIVWTLNCFEYSDDPITYASYFLPSFMSHSCYPNAMWTTAGEQFVIRAQRELEVGDELTVSYLTEEFGLRPKDRRIEHLKSTKFFTCDCLRCTSQTDDTRGFSLSSTCYVRFPEWSACAHCSHASNLSEPEISNFLTLEKKASDLVNYYDDGAGDDVIPTRTNPDLFTSDADAIELESTITSLGPAHWTYSRGFYQLSQYYKAIARYPKAIACLKLHLHSRSNFVKACDPQVSSSYAWSLEELGDLLLLHVSGAVMAGLSEQRREDHCLRWIPKGDDDYETLENAGIIEAFSESAKILAGIFGDTHEHTTTAIEKLSRVKNLLQRYTGGND